MASTAFGWVALIGSACLFVGCDDDRNVADLGGAGAAVVGGAAGAENGVGGAEGGAGGAGGAEGGAGGALACPTNIFAADGEPCPTSAEGMICSDGADNPCEFGQSIVCQSGHWWRQESFPAPCGGAGGAAGASGAPNGAGTGGAP